MFKNLSIKARLIFVIGFLSVLLIGIGVIGLVSLGTTNASLESVYKARVVPLGQLERISALMNFNQIAAAEAVIGQLTAFPEEVSEVDKRVAVIRKGMEEINALWKAYTETQLTEEEKKLV